MSACPGREGFIDDLGKGGERERERDRQREYGDLDDVRTGVCSGRRALRSVSVTMARFSASGVGERA